MLSRSSSISRAVLTRSTAGSVCVVRRVSSITRSVGLITRPSRHAPSSSSFRTLSTTTTFSSPTMSEGKPAAFHELKAEQPGGKVFEFDQLKGKVVLIVNVASKCGFTPQYKGLQALYDKYKDRDFVILGFPCNQFGGQEPGDDAAVGEFCQLNYGVSFPIMKKSDVNGDNANEVYKYLKEQKSGLLGLTRIKWNFEKFLVDKNGKVVNRWASTTSPDAIAPEIERLL